MHYTKNSYQQIAVFIFCLFIIACNSGIDENGKVTNPKKMNDVASENIKSLLGIALSSDGKINDSSRLKLVDVVNDFYATNNFQPIWSSKTTWAAIADSLFELIENAEQEGLFPKDYHAQNLEKIKFTLDKDSIKRMDPSLWANADVLLTDAFINIAKDLKYGRLRPDSITIDADTIVTKEFFLKQLETLNETKQFSGILNALQPTIKGYWELKKGIKLFLDSMDRKTYTYVTYPYKKGNKSDSVFFIKTVQKRLNESSAIAFTNKLPDSSQLDDAVKKYQRQKGLKADGKITSSLIKTMNVNDVERFKRIAITLDRYKQLPQKMPKKYIWVNLPEYFLWVIENDTIVLASKVICGKPDTRTPLLNSNITDMITYPTWTVPNSIITKQYLPKLKNNPGYLARLGLKLVNGKGKDIDGRSINWSKYSKGIPYRVVQNSGDNNALGIFKFNFSNPYQVYLHDTNQRYLFNNASRALSHGCVRVQEWEKLAYFIAKNDSLNLKPNDTLLYNTDSIKNWIAGKEKRRIDVKNKIPLFIRYFSCVGKEGKIKFYDDIYGEDKAMREQYFAGK